jgi:DNA-directed RNA polymerase specialized sigma subunit
MLHDYQNIAGNIQRLNYDLNDLLQNKIETETNLKAMKLQHSSGGGGTNDSTYLCVQKLLDNYDEKIKDIAFNINKAIIQKEETEKLFEILNVEERRMITYRYFEKTTMDKISKKMHFSLRSCYTIQKNAIVKMQEKYKSLHAFAEKL